MECGFPKIRPPLMETILHFLRAVDPLAVFPGRLEPGAVSSVEDPWRQPILTA
jgi:hypothetical protein